MVNNQTSGIVLLIEDDRDTSVLLGAWLEQRGYDVDYAIDGLEGLALAQNSNYDAVVLDVALPRMDGIEVCRQIRGCERGAVPILMITAQDSLEEKLAGLDVGADAYLTKPFFPEELEARMAALIRRRRAQVAPRVLRIGDVLLDPQQRTVVRAGNALSLSPTGFRILSILMRESPRVVTRAQLEQEVWGGAAPESDALRSHLYNLRKALDRGYPSQMLRTLPHVGYSLSSGGFKTH